VATAADIVQRSPLLSQLVEKVSLDEIRFRGGQSLSAFPASSRGGRGRAIRCLILDEAAHFIDNDSGAAHEAEELYRALIPATAQFGGLAPVIVSSTPAGDANWFAGLVQAGRSGQLEHGRAYIAASADMNPTLDADFLAGEERRDPDGFRGEYLAELIGSGGAFLDPELIDTCVASRGELDPSDCDAWIAGFDPSFTRDPAALVLVGRSRENPDRLLVGAVRSWPPPKGRKAPVGADKRALEDKLLSEVADVCERYGVRTVATDGYMGGVVHEALRRRGLWVEAYTLTTASKVEMFSNLKARMTAGSIELPDDAVLVAELKRLRSTFRGGSRQIETPRLQGTHCDTAIGLALAVQHIDRDGVPSTAMPIFVRVEDPGPSPFASLRRGRESASDLLTYHF
jgi:hypothetical protein